MDVELKERIADLLGFEELAPFKDDDPIEAYRLWNCYAESRAERSPLQCVLSQARMMNFLLVPSRGGTADRRHIQGCMRFAQREKCVEFGRVSDC